MGLADLMQQRRRWVEAERMNHLRPPRRDRAYQGVGQSWTLGLGEHSAAATALGPPWDCHITPRPPIIRRLCRIQAEHTNVKRAVSQEINPAVGMRSFRPTDK